MWWARETDPPGLTREIIRVDRCLVPKGLGRYVKQGQEIVFYEIRVRVPDDGWIGQVWISYNEITVFISELNWMFAQQERTQLEIQSLRVRPHCSPLIRSRASRISASVV